MTKIMRIGVVSAAKIGAVLYSILGIIYGGLIALIMALGAAAGAGEAGVLGAGAMLVIMPIIFAIMGAVGFGLMAVVYNIAAKSIGGLEIEVQK